jgi:SpoVK/Ycf46/Vps4 family AAA+-type ATPase
MVDYGAFVPEYVRAVRRQFFPVLRGLQEIEPNQFFYQPSQELVDWLSLDGQILLHHAHPIITPRGLLFTGPPGTGKSSGAKYLAQQLNLPLYKLDLGMVLSKWAGESDRQLASALEQAETFSPCVMLIDEVEKIFEIQDTSGLMTRLLAYLLWWLQERQSKVLVIMTTNKIQSIPPELYREGRVDKLVDFPGLLQTQMLPFVQELATQLSPIAELSYDEMKEAIGPLYMQDSVKHVSQAKLTERVLTLVKKKVVSTLNIKQEK